MRRLRALLVECSVEHARFVQEAFQEARDAHRLHVDCLHLEDTGDAALVLAEERYDVLLLGVGDSGGSTIADFVGFAEPFPGLPVILLIDPDHRTFASSLLRRGAQDYLVRYEFDCEPLVRTVEKAIDRQKYSDPLQSFSMLDSVTGLAATAVYNAFANWAMSGERPCCELQLILGEPCDPEGGEDRDLSILDLANAWHECVGENVLAFRAGALRFGALDFRNPCELEDLKRNLQRCSGVPWYLGWSRSAPGDSSETLFDRAVSHLCENKLAYSTGSRSV